VKKKAFVFALSLSLLLFFFLGCLNHPTLIEHNWMILSNIVETNKIETFARPCLE